MALKCPQGYTEINGKCEWMYQQGDANLDGTPNTGGDQGNGGFWSNVGNAIEQYGPTVLVGAGTFWQSQQTKNQPTTPAGTPPPSAAQKPGFPTWGYFAIGAGVLLIVVLLLRRK